MEAKPPLQAELDTKRIEIDGLDAQILALLSQRYARVREIGALKQTYGLPPRDEARWQAVLASKRNLAQSLNLSPDFIEGLYNLMHEYSLALEQEQNDDDTDGI